MPIPAYRNTPPEVDPKTQQLDGQQNISFVHCQANTCFACAKLQPGIQNVAEVKRPHGVRSESPGSLLVSPTLPPTPVWDLTTGEKAEKDQYKAHRLPPPPRSQRKEDLSSVCWYFLVTSELHCQEETSSYREGPGSGFPTILVGLQEGAGQRLNFT